MYDVVFIGAGPGGYVGAVRAAQLGLKTAVIEKDKTLGGTCLNVGCIPSKALLDSSEHYSMAQHDFKEHGIDLSQIKLNLKQMLDRKNKVVSDLTGGIEYLFKKNKVDDLRGQAKFVSPQAVELTKADGSREKIEAKSFVIATGSVPNELPIAPFDGKTIISSTEALNLPEVPKHLIVVGGGYIGLEMGSVWLRLGAKVTVVEYAPMICGTMDQGISKRLLQILKKQGFEFLLETKVTSVKTEKGQAKVTVEAVKSGEQKTLNGDVVLIAAGRRAFVDGLGLENAGLKTNERGQIEVDAHFKTSVANIYAIGDVIPGPMLAHKAEEEGVAVAETLAGLPGHVNYNTLPGIIYTWPEVASVGKTEEELKKSNTPYKSGTFPFTPNGRARAMGFTDGQVKVLAHKDTDRLLGVHIIGPRASDMIAEAVMCMEFSGSAEDLARAFHAHPTLSEALREAALNVDGRARQM